MPSAEAEAEAEADRAAAAEGRRRASERATRRRRRREWETVAREKTETGGILREFLRFSVRLGRMNSILNYKM